MNTSLGAICDFSEGPYGQKGNNTARHSFDIHEAFGLKQLI